ncbi:MAG: zf-HC2 domain-containing protein [Acidobacteria bacterium]|nr:zf-HC2 domain-containing protein [Acidobacteriota bacterium]
MNIDKMTNNTGGCGRQADLVSYLYDEVNANERAAFEHHLEVCQSCRTELTAFQRVRENLSAWEVGFSPQTEIAIPQSGTRLLREWVFSFPAWARGAALTSAAISLLLIAFTFATGRIGLNSNAGGENRAMTQAQVEALIKDAVAAERARLEQTYSQQLAGLRDQLNSEHDAKLKVFKAGVEAEIRRANRQRQSIRSFFAMDDIADPLGDGR